MQLATEAPAIYDKSYPDLFKKIRVIAARIASFSSCPAFNRANGIAIKGDDVDVRSLASPWDDTVVLSD